MIMYIFCSLRDYLASDFSCTRQKGVFPGERPEYVVIVSGEKRKKNFEITEIYGGSTVILRYYKMFGTL